MSLRLYNTMSGRVEAFTPLDARRVRLYVCGLTVYSRGHVGNYRTFVAVDLLRRALRYQGYGVAHVMNVTDVDDRIIALAAEAGLDLPAFTAPHIRSFREDMATLGLETPEEVPCATDHVPEMISLISKLVARGHTYEADGGVYFRIASFPEYGRLSRLDVAGIKAGARVDTDKYDKENARDFALWKAKEDEPEWAQWDAPFGRGRPGWHIECSAMSMKLLGKTLDIHGGGLDLQFPHHENELAQS
ncbi:MAG TPA: cysteine--tRNA ligase, partial [Vicinamibacteria bacterium]|nr:cysteine--tRNA ligase [Vicinamibacteria bacterium]